jgi:methylmalonyl-CoA mutase C-terminal domain/subunit
LKRMGSKLRVLVAKPGLDGHDKGAKIAARLLRDAGVEVIYTGLRQTIDQIVSAAIQEDVDVVALSVLSGVHMELTRKLLAELARNGAGDIMVTVGGTIASEDVKNLKELGVAEVFKVGTSFEEIRGFFCDQCRRKDAANPTSLKD